MNLILCLLKNIRLDGFYIFGRGMFSFFKLKLPVVFPITLGFKGVMDLLSEVILERVLLGLDFLCLA